MTQPSLQKKRDEERCRDGFDRWLRTLNLYSSIDWVYEPNGFSTAPDYLLTLDGHEYAVEVTKVMHRKRVGDKELPLEQLWSEQIKLIEAAEEMCRSKEVLSGIYYVDFVNANWDSSEQPRKKIIEELYRYVEATQADDTVPAQPIIVNQVQVCTIIKTSKYHANGLYRSGSMSLVDAPDSVPFCDRLREAVDHKADLLNHIDLPHILLLDEQYYREKPHKWYDCLDNYPSAMNFHTIYAVRDGDYPFPIRVGDSRWPVLHPGSDVPTY